MAEIYVKYKLIKTPNGFMTPKDIYNGGYVWKKGDIVDTVFVGNMKIYDKSQQGIISKISKKQLNEHKKERNEQLLKKYKQSQYQKLTDGLFIEAFRKKENGDDTKWLEYLKKCEKIENLTKIPIDNDK